MISTTYAVAAHSAAETHALGSRLGRLPAAGQIITLRGELGAGKTTLTQGIAAGLEIARHVTSPTFTLINEYRGRRGLRLIHIDVYRLGDSAAQAVLEASTIGLEEILDSTQEAVVVIEWAERVALLLPADRLEIALRYGDNESERMIDFVAFGPRSIELLAAFVA